MKAKVQRYKCEEAIQCTTIAPSASHSHILTFIFFYCIQQLWVDYIEFDAGSVLAQCLPINLKCYCKHAMGVVLTMNVN